MIRRTRRILSLVLLALLIAMMYSLIGDNAVAWITFVVGFCAGVWFLYRFSEGENVP